MKTISSDLQSHLDNEVTTLATCWKLARRDGTVLGFTDHDCDVMVNGTEYVAETGFSPTAIASSSGLQVDNLDVEGMLDSTAIREADVMAGLYDFAEIEVFQVNFNQPDAGSLRLRRGWLGEVALRNGRFVAEVRGISQKLSQQIGSLYSAACRAELGDAQCKVAMAGYTQTGSLSNVTSNSVFSDSARTEEDGFFTFGKLTFTSGANAGLSMEVKEFALGEFVLALPMAYDVQTGDEYQVQAGCDKSFSTCTARFDNAVNFRGEPHVPGIDRMLETSATRSEWE